VTSPIELIVIGSINHDLVLNVVELPAPGKTAIAMRSSAGVGGKGANQAAAAATVGVRTAFVGRIGVDSAGMAARSYLRGLGIDETHVVSDGEAATGSAFVTVDSAGENVIVVDPGANFRVVAAEVRRSIRSLTVANGGHRPTVLAQGELRGNILDEVAAATHELGLRFILNLAPAIDVSKETLLNSNPLVVNEGEARDLLLSLAGATTAPDTAENVAMALAERLAIPLVVTLGKRGALVIDKTARWAQPAPVAASVVDSTGAGDAFTGVLAAALSGGSSLEEATRRAVTAGAYAVGIGGTAQSHIDWKTLESQVADAPAALDFFSAGEVGA